MKGTHSKEVTFQETISLNVLKRRSLNIQHQIEGAHSGETLFRVRLHFRQLIRKKKIFDITRIHCKLRSLQIIMSK